MMKLDFVPLCVEWVYSAGDAIPALAVSSQESNKIYIYDGQGTNTPLHIFEKLHTNPVVIMKVSYVITSKIINLFSINFIENKIILMIHFFSIMPYMKHAFPSTKQEY